MTRAQIESMQARIGATPDGWWGPKSMAALKRHLNSMSPHPSPAPKPNTAACAAFFGEPGKVSIVRIKPPYRMFLYDGPETIDGIAVHAKCAESLQNILESLLEIYPTAQGRSEAGIDKFFGSYVNRPQRGGTQPSKHAWAAAIDLDANHNGLHTAWPTKSRMPLQVIEVFAQNGWVNLGAVIWRDAMHFQFTQ
jgi:hypothetical protein